MPSTPTTRSAFSARFFIVPLVALAALSVTAATAAASEQPYERFAATAAPAAGGLHLEWNGYPGRVYFIEASPDLSSGSWFYLPAIEQGFGEPIAYAFRVLLDGPDRFFWRLRHPVPDVATDDPFAHDFAGEGIPAGWRLEYDLDPFATVASDPFALGLTTLEYYLQSTGPGADPAAGADVGLLVYSP